MATKTDSISENNDVDVLDLLAEEQIANESSDYERLGRGPVGDFANPLQELVLYVYVL
jgi:hypothetical protein